MLEEHLEKYNLLLYITLYTITMESKKKTLLEFWAFLYPTWVLFSLLQRYLFRIGSK